MESTLRRVVVDAWNTLVDRREAYLPGWGRMAAQGDALERYFGRLMIATTAEGPLETEVPEMTRMFLEEITVLSPEQFIVKFRGGSFTRLQVEKRKAG